MISQPTATERAALLRSLAPERMRPYRAVFGGDSVRALDLDIFEMDLTAAIQQVIGALEVLMREAMHRALSQAYGTTWFETQGSMFDDRTREQIVRAKRDLPTIFAPGKLVAEMDFGSWTYLLEVGGWAEANQPSQYKTDYEANLWVPALQSAFANSSPSPSRAQVSLLARRARWGRNRIAHRESMVFGVPQPGQRTGTGLRVRQTPVSLLNDVRTLAGYVDRDVESWLRNCAQADALLTDGMAVAALAHAQMNLPGTWV